MLSIALGKVKELQYMAGGMVVFLESENKDRLLDFYEKQNGFKRFDTKFTKKYKENSHTLVQLLKVIWYNQTTMLTERRNNNAN